VPLVGLGHERPTAIEAVALREGAEGEDRLAAVGRQCIPERFMRWVASVLHAASVTPEPIGSFFAAQVA